MSAAGSPPTGNGSGNGATHKPNTVRRSGLFEDCRAKIEAEHPRVLRERFFEQLDAYMVICNVRDDARHLGGATFLLKTPDNFSPMLWIYFTYASGQIVLQAVHADG